ncbi:MAG: DedA family protein [Deltaproteobacteria bacterium CG11_big_fil_rev_8_21_14_0_20_47_16]|nr:MAG: DedA family protein [Deltaproteobacteria bacterium CG11_big_fil_rev_8_21_14_0_20_47_16]
MDAFLAQFSGPMLIAVYFLFLILCGFGNPIPEDLTMISGGYFVYTGMMDPIVALAVSYIGVVSGDMILYFFGYRYGQKLLEHRWLSKLTPPERVAMIRHHFKKWGHWTIFFARFLPGLRSPTFILSGVMHVKFRRFALFDGLGSLVSVPLFVGLGYFFGNHIDALKHDVHAIRSILIVASISIIILYMIYLWYRSEKVENDTPELR